MKLRRITLPILAMVIAGCAATPGSNHWVKDGASDHEAMSADADCSQRSQSMTSTTNGEIDLQAAENACMQNKGFHRQGGKS
jgi:hypothetical protein